MKGAKDLVPEQIEGVETNSSHSQDYIHIEKARKMFRLAVDRILHVNQWHSLAGKGTASFQLTDENGLEIQEAAKIGNRVKIDIPAPGTTAGQGFDWVVVEKIIDQSGDNLEKESFVMQVRPVKNPETASREISHFFKGIATSSFAVTREGSVVTTSVHGRNEKPNTSTHNLFDKIRNTLIAVFAGAGFSYPQWKRLVIALQKEDASG